MILYILYHLLYAILVCTQYSRAHEFEFHQVPAGPLIIESPKFQQAPDSHMLSIYFPIDNQKHTSKHTPILQAIIKAICYHIKCNINNLEEITELSSLSEYITNIGGMLTTYHDNQGILLNLLFAAPTAQEVYNVVYALTSIIQQMTSLESINIIQRLTNLIDPEVEDDLVYLMSTIQTSITIQNIIFLNIPHSLTKEKISMLDTNILNQLTAISLRNTPTWTQKEEYNSHPKHTSQNITGIIFNEDSSGLPKITISIPLHETKIKPTPVSIHFLTYILTSPETTNFFQALKKSDIINTSFCDLTYDKTADTIDLTLELNTNSKHSMLKTIAYIKKALLDLLNKTNQHTILDLFKNFAPDTMQNILTYNQGVPLSILMKQISQYINMLHTYKNLDNNIPNNPEETLFTKILTHLHSMVSKFELLIVFSNIEPPRLTSSKPPIKFIALKQIKDRISAVNPILDNVIVLPANYDDIQKPCYTGPLFSSETATNHMYEDYVLPVINNNKSITSMGIPWNISRSTVLIMLDIKSNPIQDDMAYNLFITNYINDMVPMQSIKSQLALFSGQVMVYPVNNSVAILISTPNYMMAKTLQSIKVMFESHHQYMNSYITAKNEIDLDNCPVYIPCVKTYKKFLHCLNMYNSSYIWIIGQQSQHQPLNKVTHNIINTLIQNVPTRTSIQHDSIESSEGITTDTLKLNHPTEPDSSNDTIKDFIGYAALQILIPKISDIVHRYCPDQYNEILVYPYTTSCFFSTLTSHKKTPTDIDANISSITPILLNTITKDIFTRLHQNALTRMLFSPEMLAMHISCNKHQNFAIKEWNLFTNNLISGSWKECLTAIYSLNINFLHNNNYPINTISMYNNIPNLHLL